MVKGFRAMITHWVKDFGRPPFDLGNDDKIHEADKKIDEISRKDKELQARMKLLDIKGSPRGFNG